MNVRLDQAGNLDRMSDDALAKSRAAFEKPWLRANLGRTPASTAAFGSLIWALIEFGR
jgi:hypothetical protein